MKIIKPSAFDASLLHSLVEKGIPPRREQPVDYKGLVVIKPWGFELEVFSGPFCAVWLACLKSGEAVSMHCHQKKRAIFTPLTDGIVFKTLNAEWMLTECVVVEQGAFHSQENRGAENAWFLECESSPDKTDLVRWKDRYGREGKAYEGKNEMIRIEEASALLNIPASIKLLAEIAA